MGLRQPGAFPQREALVLRGQPRALLKELAPEPRAIAPSALAGAAMQLQRRSLSAAAVRSTAARPRISLPPHASGGVARRDDLAVLDHGVFAVQVHRL